MINTFDGRSHVDLDQAVLAGNRPMLMGNRPLSGRSGYAGTAQEERKMTAVKIESGDWVVVCDGRKALILRNAGDAKFPNLQSQETHEDVNPATHDQGSDRPGRVHESAGISRSSVAQTDWHDRREQAFLIQLAKRLDQAVAGGEAHKLIVIAPRRALGVLRDAYSPALREAVREEIAKDYVNKPVYEIEKLLAAASV
jgi:protein required for attachment to host cells